MPRPQRKATHSGSWYNNEPRALEQEIQSWLAAADAAGGFRESAKAIIAPHAGYRYSGHVMAYAYRFIDPSKVSRVFLLGPSHHLYTQNCLLSGATDYLTPFGSIEVDTHTNQQLLSTGAFETMPLHVDEAEHSLELHLPYIAYIMRGRPFTLVPIMVGALAHSREAVYGRLLAQYLEDPANVFIVSSDFCHWGSRFNYTFYEKAQGAIHESIKWLDDLAVDAIKQVDPEAFQQYMRRYSNTICGRHPIAVLLQMLKCSRLKAQIELKKYDQSSQCVRMSDSSVSYASLIVNVAS